MSGDRVANAARRLMRHDTYTLIVSPAVADLQRARMAGASRQALGRLWLGVARAAIGALLIDLAGDFRGAMRLSLHGADRWFAVSALGVTAAVVVAYQPPLRGAPASTQALLTLSLLPSAAAAGLLFGLVPIGRAFAARPAPSGREVVAAAALFTIVIFLLMDQAVWRANAAYRAVAINEIAGGRTTIEDEMRFERGATGGARRRMLPFAASAGALLMLGAALRRRHAALTPLVTAGCLAMYVLLQPPGLASVLREWLPALVLYAVALAALALSTAAVPRHPQAA